MLNLLSTLTTASASVSQSRNDCDIEGHRYTEFSSVYERSIDSSDERKKKKRKPSKTLRLLIAIGFLTQDIITGALQTSLIPLVGQAILHACHLPGYDAHLPLSMAIGAAGGGPVIGLAYTFNRIFLSKDRIFLRKNNNLKILADTASFVLLLHFVGGVLIAGACSLGVVMLRHVLPESMDPMHAAYAGILGYSILTGPVMVVMIVLFPYYDLRYYCTDLRRRWKETHPAAVTAAPSPQRTTCQQGEAAWAAVPPS
ncbi:hypothetical protein HYDPIDRAFT_26277 [Hydnomerulius pinastri MD-312]|nr:hypothetical protein HYDPIDRAFT_26277 [Hydnomerulius pinastri MD-312]